MERLTRTIDTPRANRCLKNKTVIFSRKGERRLVIINGEEHLKVPFQICVLDHNQGIIKVLTEEGNSYRVPIKGTKYLEFTPPFPIRYVDP